MAYVYRHIRLDKNEPFYIGIGSDSKYHRSGERTRRNNLWKKIAAKTDYSIEILVDNISFDFAKQKEVEFIALYGRLVDGSGTLANLTLGGEGAKGYIMSEETKRKISEAQKGRPVSEERRQKIIEARRKAVLPPRTAEHNAKLSLSKIGRPRTEETKKKLRLASLGQISARRRQIASYDTNGNLVKIYDYVLKAAKELNKSHSCIVSCANGRQKTAYGLIWKYL